VVASRRLPGKEATLETETFSHVIQRRSSRRTEVCPQNKFERHINGVMNALVAHPLVTSLSQATVLAKEDMHVVDLQDQGNHSARGGIARGRRNRPALEQEHDRSCCCQSVQKVPGAWNQPVHNTSPLLWCAMRCTLLDTESLHDRVCKRECVLEAHSVGDVWKDDVR
jgi:hypothetical protein